MREKPTPEQPKEPSEPASDTITASDIIDTAKRMGQASIAREMLSQKQSSDALPPEQFWDKETIETMRKRYGRNFSQADKILRELAKIGMEVETCRFILGDIQERTRRAMEREKELSQKILSLGISDAKKEENQHGK